MFILKNEIIEDDISELFEVRNKLKPLEKKEEILSKQIKKRLNTANETKEISANGLYIAEKIEKSKNEICATDLHKKVSVIDFINLVNVKMKETKAFLSKKDLEEIIISKPSFSLKIKEVEK